MYTYTRRAHYHETDKMGIIHHSNYIKWMEEARIAYMEHLGYGFERVEELGVMSPVAGLTISYKTPSRFNDEIAIKVSVTRYSGVVQEISYEFMNKTTGQVCATASSKHCYTKDGKIVNLKHEIPELHEIFSKELVKA